MSTVMALLTATAERRGLAVADLLDLRHRHERVGRVELVSTRDEAIAVCTAAGLRARDIGQALGRPTNYVQISLRRYLRRHGRLPGAVVASSATPVGLPLVDAVLQAVAGVFGLTLAAIKAPGCTSIPTRPRFIAMAILRDAGGLSYRRLAGVFRLADHKTAMHGVRRGRDLLQAHPDLQRRWPPKPAPSASTVRSAQ